MKNIIVIKKGKRVETWSSFTKLCKAHGFSYHSIKMFKYPFKHEGWKFRKIKHNTKSND